MRGALLLREAGKITRSMMRCDANLLPITSGHRCSRTAVTIQPAAHQRGVPWHTDSRITAGIDRQEGSEVVSYLHAPGA